MGKERTTSCTGSQNFIVNLTERFDCIIKIQKKVNIHLNAVENF